MGDLSDHLSASEYRCRCCGKLPPQFVEGGLIHDAYKTLFYTFERIREMWQKPLIVTSGYRCKARNAAVGGEGCSPHLFGLALDLKVDSFEEARILAYAAKKTGLPMRLGYKKYNVPTFHFDVAFLIEPSPSEYFQPGVEW